MALRITTLVENNQGENKALKNEHGLCFYIEKDNHRILFDTGQSRALLHNAAQLRIDLELLDFVVLSHGHYDHTGGLIPLMEMTTEFELVTGPGLHDEKYAFANQTYEFLGNNFDEKFIRGKGIKHHCVNEQVLEQQVTEICPEVFILSGFPRIHDDETINPRFKVRCQGQFRDDKFEDEIMMAIDTPMGLVAILGCSHPGMKNMLDMAHNLLKKPIHAVLGGTHLVEADDISLDLSMAYLEKKSIDVIGFSHCTGEVATKRLAKSNRQYSQNCTGTSLFIN